MKNIYRRLIRWIKFEIGINRLRSSFVNDLDLTLDKLNSMISRFFNESMRLYPAGKQIPIWLAKDLEYELSVILGCLVRYYCCAGGKITSLPRYPVERVHRYQRELESLLGKTINLTPESTIFEGLNCRDLGITVTGRKLMQLLDQVLVFRSGRG